MSLDQLVLIYRAQLSFFDDELAADDCVICIDGLPKNDCRDGIMHSGKTNPIQIDSEEIGTLFSFQTTDIGSSQNGCPAARAEIERFTSSHQLAIGIIG